MHCLKKTALENILKAAEPFIGDMGTETKTAFKALREICDNANETIQIADLARCQESILWTGEDDVRMLIETGGYQDEAEQMTEDELNQLVAEVVSRVDWSDVAFAGCNAGNSIINDELDAVFEKLQSKEEN